MSFFFSGKIEFGAKPPWLNCSFSLILFFFVPTSLIKKKDRKNYSDGRVFAIGRSSAVDLLGLFDGRRQSVVAVVFGSVRWAGSQLEVQVLVGSFERSFLAFLLLDDLTGVLLVDARL